MRRVIGLWRNRFCWWERITGVWRAIPGPDPKIFAPNHQKFLVKYGIHIMENLDFGPLIEAEVYEFAFSVCAAAAEGCDGIAGAAVCDSVVLLDPPHPTLSPGRGLNLGSLLPPGEGQAGKCSCITCGRMRGGYGLLFQNRHKITLHQHPSTKLTLHHVPGRARFLVWKHFYPHVVKRRRLPRSFSQTVILMMSSAVPPAVSTMLRMCLNANASCSSSVGASLPVAGSTPCTPPE